MAKTSEAAVFDRHEETVALRDPGLAALLAWLLPGLGHLYQRRTAKGVLFMTVILATYFMGLFLGEGRVVYASFGPQEVRLHYLSQVGVGLPALPALVQWQLVRSGKEPFFPKSRFMVPPGLGGGPPDELPQLHRNLNRRWELGSVYTMIAGLLNMLVIYDAWAGPAYGARRREDDDSPPDEKSPSPGPSS